MGRRQAHRAGPGFAELYPPAHLLPFCSLLCLALVAGCGGTFSAAPGTLQIDAGPQAVHTGEHLHLSAATTGSDEQAPVAWRIVGSDNAPALGAGTISADGVYTPPSTLSRDVVTVTIAATPTASAASAAAPVTTTLSVTPGFVQPLQPENASLTPGSSIEVRAQLAEVSSGAITWNLENAAGATLAANVAGSLSAQLCVHGSRDFTTCTVTYTAPTGIPSGGLVWLVASTHGSAAQGGVSARARLMVGALASNPALHQAEQGGSIMLGGSGGNADDFDTYKDATGTRFVADCCGGTLGALVEDQAGTTYVLSNNHVLALSDQAQPGDTIVQPGLIDEGCVPLSQPGAQAQAVGTLRYAVPLKSSTSNVDAALASVAPGAVDATGAVLELGAQPSQANAQTATWSAEAALAASAQTIQETSAASLRETSPASLRSAPPTAGTGEVLDASRLSDLSVVKSGRTTGLTCSTVEAVDLRVAVDYYKDCAETEPYTTKTFTGQIGIAGEAFADSGDSGALVLDAANARAIGLLYATGTASATSGLAGSGSGLSLANPIGDVLAELGTLAGSPITIRGTSTPHAIACLDYDKGAATAWPLPSTLTPDERARVASAVEAAGALGPSTRSGILAVGAGASEDEPGRGAVIIYVDRTLSSVSVPATIRGVRTVVVPADLGTIARGPAAWPMPAARSGLQLPATVLASARSTAERLAPLLMDKHRSSESDGQRSGVLGVGVSQSLDNPEEPALLLLIDSDASSAEVRSALARAAAPGEMADAESPLLPAVLGGMRVRYVTMHRFRVTQSKYVAQGTPSSCSIR